MDEVDDDAFLLAHANQPLALRRVAQGVERQLDGLLALVRLVVVRFFGLRVRQERVLLRQGNRVIFASMILVGKHPPSDHACQASNKCSRGVS